MPSSSRLQRTIARDTEVHGVGFFHGHDVALRFRPAPADSGVAFVRTDLPGRPEVRAHIDNVVPSPRRTRISQNDASVEMIEHVMAALAGLCVDNCRIEIDGPELPGLDGSSLAYVEAIGASGTLELDRAREVLVVENPVTVRDGHAVIAAYPGGGEGLVLSYQLDYGRRSPIGTQSFFLEVTPVRFAEDLAPSRTFLLSSEAEALRKAGVGRRASEADLLIFGPDGVIGNALRYPDECVRHKILDMVGDLALLGCDIRGHVVAHLSGHALNASLVRALAASAVRESSEPESRPVVALHTIPSGEASDIESLMRSLPQRFPMPMVDRVVSLEPGHRLTAVKNVSFNEPFLGSPFRGGEPVMPGGLVLEALGQAAALLLGCRGERASVPSAIDEVRVRNLVGPGDQLVLEVHCHGQTATGVAVRGLATVGGLVAAEARFTFLAVDADRTAA